MGTERRVLLGAVFAFFVSALVGETRSTSPPVPPQGPIDLALGAMIIGIYATLAISVVAVVLLRWSERARSHRW